MKPYCRPAIIIIIIIAVLYI